MEEKKIIRVDPVTHQHIKIMASETSFSMEEYLQIVIRDEWDAFLRRHVAYLPIEKELENNE